jgi:hypothetical protein
VYEPETTGQFGSNPERQLAADFIEEFKLRLAGFKAYDTQNSPSQAELNHLNEVAALMIHKSLYDKLPFRLLVTVPDEAEAETSINFRDIDKTVRQFEAEYITYMGYNIDRFQVDFCDGDKDDLKTSYFVVYGFEIDVTPVF